MSLVCWIVSASPGFSERAAEELPMHDLSLEGAARMDFRKFLRRFTHARNAWTLHSLMVKVDKA